MNRFSHSLWIASYIFLLIDTGTAFASDSRYVRREAGAASVIVFVHGIFGNSHATWTGNNNSYFPELLTKDAQFDHQDIYVYEYPTSFLNGPFSIDEISENMRLFFDADAVGSHKDVIFVVHSMGGLAVRAYLLKNRDVASRTRLIYFFSTPTTGSEIASIGTIVSSNPQLAKMQPMRSADYLADLQRQWLSANLNIPSFCAYETQKTYGISVVTQSSASNLCTKRLDPIDADHLTIVKPSGNRSVSYLALKSAIAQTPSLVPIRLPANVLQGSKSAFSHDRMLDMQGYMYSSEKTAHTAFVRLSVSFQDNRMNKPVFLRSFDTVSAKLLDPGGAPAKTISSNFKECSQSEEIFRCILVLKFSAKPEFGSVLHIQIGPVNWQHAIQESTFVWENTTNEKYKLPWTVATSEVSYEIENLSWMVASDAEILVGADGFSLVRFAVTNPTGETRSIRSIGLRAVYPLPHFLSCANGDPAQQLTIKWDKIVSGQQDAATTTFQGIEISVPVTYNYVGICNHSYSISADVPVSEQLSPYSTKQIFLRIRELPPLTESAGRGSFSRGRLSSVVPDLDAPPTRLEDWPILQMALSIAGGLMIKPSILDIQNPKKESRQAVGQPKP